MDSTWKYVLVAGTTNTYACAATAVTNPVNNQVYGCNYTAGYTIDNLCCPIANVLNDTSGLRCCSGAVSGNVTMARTVAGANVCCDWRFVTLNATNKICCSLGNTSYTIGTKTNTP